jgi:hypothetical protein
MGHVAGTLTLEAQVRSRTITLAIGAALIATFAVATAAFADTLTVAFAIPTTFTPTSVSGAQHTVWHDAQQNKDYTYDGTYSFSVTGFSNGCIVNPAVTLGYTSATSSHLNIQFQSPYCTSVGSTANFTILNTSDGVFAGATGGGTVTYQAPDTGIFQGEFGSPGTFGATPELDSLILFGAGALGLGGYAMARFRARKRSGSG